MATYDVIVGNIGTVRSEVSLMEARSVYRDYVHKSKAGEGRAAPFLGLAVWPDPAVRRHAGQS